MGPLGSKRPIAHRLLHPAFFCLVGAGIVTAGHVSGSQPSAKSTALETKAAGEKRFYCDDRAGNNQVTVLSESTLEDFTCVCNRVAGECAIDPTRVESFSGRFSIRADELKSGLELRDQHMVAADWLNTAEHPEITIAIDEVDEVNRTAPTTASLVLVGTCQIRGTTKAVRIPASLTYLDETPETMRRVKGDLLRIRANFPIKLSDYGVTGPAGSDFIGLKVADTINVKVTVFGSTERPPDPLKADKPEESTKRTPPPPPRPPSKPTSSP